MQSLKATSWILNDIIRDPKRIVKFNFLMHYFLMLENGKMWMIDIFIALLCMQALICHFLSFYAIFALKFRPILTKDFHCLNSDNLRKWNLSIQMRGFLWLFPYLCRYGVSITKEFTWQAGKAQCFDCEKICAWAQQSTHWNNNNNQCGYYCYTLAASTAPHAA